MLSTSCSRNLLTPRSRYGSFVELDEEEYEDDEVVSPAPSKPLLKKHVTNMYEEETDQLNRAVGTEEYGSVWSKLSFSWMDG